jgi:hypothetical protein
VVGACVVDVTGIVVLVTEVDVVVTISPVVVVDSPLSDPHADRTTARATDPASNVVLRLMDRIL